MASTVLHASAVPAPPAVETDSAAIKLPAVVKIDPGRTAQLTLPAAGRVTSLKCVPGQKVQEGDVLAIVQSEAADRAVSDALQAEAGLRLAEQSLRHSQSNRHRVEALLQGKAVPLKELLEAEREVANATAMVDSARAALQRANSQLSFLRLTPGEFGQSLSIRSPITGTVLGINAGVGEYVADPARPLINVADLRKLWVVASIRESELQLVRPADTVTVRYVAYPGEQERGTIHRIEDLADGTTRTVGVWIAVTNMSGRVKPGMYATVELQSPMLQSRGDLISGSSGRLIRPRSRASNTKQRRRPNAAAAPAAVVADLLPPRRLP